MWRAYEEAKPKEGAAFYAWVEETAERLGLSEAMVQKAVADESAALALAMRQQNRSIGQQVADLMGASVVDAIAVMREGMRATAIRIFRDKQGKPIMDPNTNEVLQMEVPLHEVRVRAAKEMLKVHGAFAPQQIEVNQKVLHAELSDVELFDYIRDLKSTINTLERELTCNGSEAGASHARIEGPEGDPGSVLLVDGMYSDGGRAGSGESEQAVPQESLHSSPSELAE